MTNKWISVKERLPDHATEVLVRHETGSKLVLRFTDHVKMMKEMRENGLVCSDYEPGEYSFSSSETPGKCLSGITHWMTLPKFHGDH